MGEAARVSKVEDAHYCRCGAMMSVRMRGFHAEEEASHVRLMFWSLHAGDGHGPCSAQEAATARRRAEEALAGR